EGIGYEGKIYRSVTKQLNASKIIDLSYQHIFIAGFNALSKTEQQLFKYLKKTGKAEFFWDFDPFYFDDKEHEAGFFVRKMVTDFS
ncbi:MAG: hypothetical protein COZ08_05940, partial [Bacteroidetes bacterium CG_4_10_14_3_um_filter_42_6]